MAVFGGSRLVLVLVQHAASDLVLVLVLVLGLHLGSMPVWFRPKSRTRNAGPC